MTNVQEIETAIQQLTREELSAFRSWFEEFDAEFWEYQFQVDVQAGRLDSLADEALIDLKKGKATDL